MKKFKMMILSALAVLTVGLAVSPVALAASCTTAAQCVKDGVNAPGPTGGPTDVNTVFKSVTNILLFVLGAIAVIMIIIGGIKYVLSQGDQSALTSAKNTILYSVIGLIVALVAYGIVNFVVDNFTS